MTSGTYFQVIAKRWWISELTEETKIPLAEIKHTVLFKHFFLFIETESHVIYAVETTLELINDAPASLSHKYSCVNELVSRLKST